MIHHRSPNGEWDFYGDAIYCMILLDSIYRGNYLGISKTISDIMEKKASWNTKHIKDLCVMGHYWCITVNPNLFNYSPILFYRNRWYIVRWSVVGSQNISHFLTHRIHGAAIYGNMDPINIPQSC